MIFAFTILCFIFLFLPSLPLQALINFPTQLIPVLAFALFAITLYRLSANKKSYAVSPLTKLIFFLSLFLSFCYLIVNQSIIGALRLLMVVPFALLADILVHGLPPNAISQYSNFLRLLIMFSCISAFALQVFTTLNCLNVFEAFNMNGRLMCFAYTSFSPIIGGLTFRPSFLYDEPGGLILVSAALLAISNLSVVQSSLFILILSTITSSLGGLVSLALSLLLLFAKLLVEKRFVFIPFLRKKRLIKVLLLSPFIGALTVLFMPFFQSNFESRFTFSPRAKHYELFSGDNRSSSIVDTLTNLNPDIFWSGAIEQKVPEGIGNTGGDIFSPLWFYGFFHWIFYISVLLFLLYLIQLCIYRISDFGSLLAVSFLFFMLLSRPHIQWYPYAAPCFLAIYFLYKKIATSSSPLKRKS